MEGQGFPLFQLVPANFYSENFKRMVVREFELGRLNKKELGRKYGIPGHATILKWCRKYGKLHYAPESTIIGRPMKDPQKQRIKALEKELENERLKVIALKKLIEIAEREDGISISKKDVARQLKILRKSIHEK
jgi:transposase-like protein